jgi:hydroxyacid-oxoacid transhydrogenase
MMTHDTAFEMATSSIRFGPGVTREIGMDLADMDVKRVMVLTDPNLSRLAPVATVLESLSDSRIEFVLFDRVRVEPTDLSFQEAIAAATQGRFDGFVAVGGGSTIDTAKAANLYSTYPPADFLDYVNQPVGKGLPVPGPLKPLVAVPTTAGTGSETTGIAIFDYTALHAKTASRIGVSSRRWHSRPGQHANVAAPQVAAASGLDVLSHAVESLPPCLSIAVRCLNVRRCGRRTRGSNPVSDIWSRGAANGSQVLVRAVEDSPDHEARARMLLAAACAGIGF